MGEKKKSLEREARKVQQELQKLLSRVAEWIGRFGGRNWGIYTKRVESSTSKAYNCQKGARGGGGT